MKKFSFIKQQSIFSQDFNSRKSIEDDNSREETTQPMQEIKSCKNQKNLDMYGLPPHEFDLMRYTQHHDIEFQKKTKWDNISRNILQIGTTQSQTQMPHQVMMSSKCIQLQKSRMIFRRPYNTQLNKSLTLCVKPSKFLDVIDNRSSFLLIRRRSIEIHVTESSKFNRLNIIAPQTYVNQHLLEKIRMLRKIPKVQLRVPTFVQVKNTLPSNLKQTGQLSGQKQPHKKNSYHSLNSSQSDAKKSLKKVTDKLKIINLLQIQRTSKENQTPKRFITRQVWSADARLSIKQSDQIELKMLQFDQDCVENKDKKTFKRKRSLDTLKNLFKQKIGIIKTTNFLQRLSKQQENEADLIEDLSPNAIQRSLFNSLYRLSEIDLDTDPQKIIYLKEKSEIELIGEPISKSTSQMGDYNRAQGKSYIQLNKKLPQLQKILQYNKCIISYTLSRNPSFHSSQNPKEINLSQPLDQILKKQIKNQRRSISKSMKSIISPKQLVSQQTLGLTNQKKQPSFYLQTCAQMKESISKMNNRLIQSNYTAQNDQKSLKKVRTQPLKSFSFRPLKQTEKYNLI